MPARRVRARGRTSRSGRISRSGSRNIAIVAGALAFVAAAAASIVLQSESRFLAPEEIPLAAGCITDKSGFRALAGTPEFFVELTNACGRRARCTLHVNVTGSRGSRTSSATLVLPAGSPGQETTKSWATPTAENGGMASLSRKCVGI